MISTRLNAQIQAWCCKEEEDLTVDSTKLALSVNEVAKNLSLSPWTIRRWIRLGTMRSIRLGRRVLIEPGEMRRVVARGRERAISVGIKS